MAVKSNFASGDVLTASDTNTYLTNGGLVYVTQLLVTAGSSTAVSFNNCFTSTYDNYRVVIDSFQPSVAGRGLQLRLRVGGVDAAGTDYYYSCRGLYVDSTSADVGQSGVTVMDTFIYNSTNTLAVCAATWDIFRPFKAERTMFLGNSMLYNAQFGCRNGMGEHNLATSYDGFTLLMNSTGNITNVNVRVYGYRQA